MEKNEKRDNPYRVLVFDLDGTLTNSQKKVSERTREALTRARLAGCEIVLASGRPIDGVMPIARELSMDRLGGYVVALNGAVIIDCRTGKTVYEKAIPRELIPGICRYAREHGIPLLTYVPGAEISDHPEHPEVIREAQWNGLPLRHVEDFEKNIPDPVENIMLIDNPEPLEKACRELNRLYGSQLTIYRSSPCFLEVLPLGVHKAGSLEVVLGWLGYEKRQMMAFGDAVNDREMLEMAGMGVCMANGDEAARAAADYVTASNDEDGVALALERFVL
ncbi:MAG: HAD family phosphatase [Lachnospiraceae bacterium]|nr:HAD family phosphatase [Lachnospiraceae bacterium]